MILEQVLFSVTPGSESDFESAIGQAQDVISQADGFRSLRFQRGIEHPSTFLLLVEWDSVDDHMVGFRGSDLYKRWRELIGPYFAADPQVQHFESPSVVK